MSKMIECIKFCGAFELMMKVKHSIFMVLVDFVDLWMQTVSVTETVQNELLDCRFSGKSKNVNDTDIVFSF